MGVHGLWQLIQSTGKTVSLESLEGKTLAVDVSIWLHQAIKGMRDKDGNTLPNAHLQVLFNRVCKLLYYRIKPVFVFDGGVPILKKQTLASRRQRKEFAEQESERTSKKLLENMMRKQAVKEVLSGDGSTDVKPTKLKVRAKDIFELPPVPDEFINISEELSKDGTWEERIQTQTMIKEELDDVNEFDTTSEEFLSLPSELKHEILTELKERTNRTSWTNIDELPEESDDFSNYQMKRILKRGKLTHQLDSVRKEMTTRTSGVLTQGFTDDFYSDEIQSQRVISTDASHYILIKGIGQKKQEMLAKQHLDKKIDALKFDREDTCVAKDSEKNEFIGNDELLLDSDEDSKTQTKKKEQKRNESRKTNISKSAVKEIRKENIYDSANKEKFKEHRFDNLSTISDEVITVSDDVTTISDDVITVSDDVTTTSDDVITVSGITTISDDDPKPSTSKSGLYIQSDTGVHNLESEDESDEDLSQQEILAMIKNENMNSRVKDKRINLSDEDSDDSDKEYQTEVKDKMQQKNKFEVTKQKKVTPVRDGLVIDGKSNKKISPVQKFLVKNLNEKEVRITERKRRLSLETEISVDIKKQKQKIYDEAMIAVGSKDDSITENGNISKGDNSVVTIGDDDSEDEGFIEVSIDPNKVKPDELFPEDIFAKEDSQKQNLSDNSKEDTNESAREITPQKNSSVVSENLSEEKMEENLDVPVSEKENDTFKHGDLAKDFEGLSEFDLQNWEDDLETESRSLKQEMGKQERLATSITDEMFIEAQALLKIFGMPYVVSPTEAEAQCALLDRLDLTQGTITDDSDIWLFGGKRVYKNFYQKDKHVEFYTNVSVQSQLGLNRQLLINIALLCGSDYTDGIQGVGPVKAMEIMTEFPGEGIRGLEYFRNWWEECQTQPKLPHEPKIRSQLRKLDIRPGFPNLAVVEAYLNPTVDDSDDPFSWSKPDLYQLREFAGEKLGWSKTKIDEILLPVMKRLNEQEFQSKIHMYFQPENFVKPAKVKSKRLKSALDKFVGSPEKLSRDSSSEKIKQDGDEKKSKVKRSSETKVKEQSDSKGKGQSKKESKGEKNNDEYKKMAKIANEIEEFKNKNQMDNSNEAKLRRVRERLGIKMPKIKMPKGRGQNKGRGRGKAADVSCEADNFVLNQRSDIKIKDEIDLSESSGSSGDELIANLDLESMLGSANSNTEDSKVSMVTIPERSREPGGFIIDEDDDSDNDRKSQRSKVNYGKGKGKGKSSRKKVPSSARGHSLTASLRNKTTRTSKSKAESRISRLQLSESDSEND